MVFTVEAASKLGMRIQEVCMFEEFLTLVESYHTHYLLSRDDLVADLQYFEVSNEFLGLLLSKNNLIPIESLDTNCQVNVSLSGSTTL